MDFDATWFDELAAITPDKVQLAEQLCTGRERRARVSYLRMVEAISPNFRTPLDDLIRKLYKKGYQLSPDFLAHRDAEDAQHIYNFTHGKALRKQWNVGFSANDTPYPYTMRVGIGFPLEQETEPRGIKEYGDFLMEVSSRPGDFDNTFGPLGNFAEPIILMQYNPLSSFVHSDVPAVNKDWRFFGKRLRYDDPNHQRLFHSVDLLVDEICAVFGRIKRHKFGRSIYRCL
jgi:hypothetical protein